MLDRIRERAFRHPYLTVVLVVALVVLTKAIAFETESAVRWHLFMAQVQAAEHAESTEEPAAFDWVFTFQGSRQTIAVEMDIAQLESVSQVDASRVFDPPTHARERYVRGLILQQSESRLVSSLADGFRDLASELGLDSDEYVELMVRAVQSIPYGEISSDIKLPAEVLVSDSGVCTEKTLLLGALLVHEGYDTSVWVFDSLRHVALGIACDSEGYRDTGYAFVETTEDSFVGETSASYRGNGPRHQPPQAIQVGGTLTYDSTREVQLILEELDDARVTSRRLARYEEYAEEMPGELGETWRDYVRERRDASSLATFITTNADDREKVYSRLLMLRGESEDSQDQGAQDQGFGGVTP